MILGLWLPVVGGAPCHGQSAFASDWAETPDRTWVGPAHWANRLHDWRVHDGRLECVEGRERWPLRTLHLLTHAVAPDDARGFRLQVRTGALAAVEPDDADLDARARGWSGFLIGAGGPQVDHRLSAMVHHRPAEDGGLLAVVDGIGRVAILDNANPARSGNQWSIAGPIAPEDTPVLAISEPPATPHRPGAAVALELEAAATPGGYELALSATEVESGRLLSRTVLRDVTSTRVDGGVALVSHLGPAGQDQGHWFRRWAVAGAAVEPHPHRAFGPVLSVLYTVSGEVLKLTAQLGPIGAWDTRTGRLEVQDPGGAWRTIAHAEVVEHSYTLPFRVEGWTAERAVPFRVVYDLAARDGSARPMTYAGMIRREPRDAEQFVIGSLNCHKIYTGGLKWNHNGIWFPHVELVDALAHHDPDLLFFAGDQIYEGDLDPAQARPEERAGLDYLHKWYRWCWAFAPLTRRTPTVVIPDDHDVYHGNIWGAGGRAARARDGLSAQDAGGYKMSPRFVNMVHRTQTSHLPDDRQFKSSASVMVPEGQVRNGWFQNDDFDPVDADVPGAVLLGERQLSFLREWATDWSDGIWMKVALSQTPFVNVATIPADARSGSVIPSLPYLPETEYPTNHRLAADTDSGGWPQRGRRRAITELRRGFAVHLAGDQHLSTLVQYGLDEWRDSGFAFTSPAIANTWPRRWFPPVPGARRAAGAPKYTGDFRDGFGNRMTVYAVSNPVLSGREPANLYNRTPGYGIVRLDRGERTITFECWPRWIDPRREREQYLGWPHTIRQLDNRGGGNDAWLPRVQVEGMDEPVVQVVDEPSGDIEYAIRLASPTFRPFVAGDGPYTIRVGEPGTPRWREYRGLLPSAEERTLVVGWGLVP
jgi:hypothetical protein